MYICYLDESGVSDIPGNTSHYVLAGLSIPIWHWKTYENAITTIKKTYDIESSEIHTGWIVRSYIEQAKIKNFVNLNYSDRRQEVEKYRNAEILKLRNSKNHKLYLQVKKNFIKTSPYIHLTKDERNSLVKDLAQKISSWGSARLFAECVDKIYFDPRKTPLPLVEEAFEQVVSRFERYLHNLNQGQSASHKKIYGMLVHDNNSTVEKRLTNLMKSFHQTGTFWTQIHHIVETPLFVNSELSSMVQMIDLCSFALRRYLENGDKILFDLIFTRADKSGNATVGIRHLANPSCVCQICTSHRGISSLINGSSQPKQSPL
jgi:hypothetical protein